MNYPALKEFAGTPMWRINSTQMISDLTDSLNFFIQFEPEDIPMDQWATFGQQVHKFIMDAAQNREKVVIIHQDKDNKEIHFQKLPLETGDIKFIADRESYKCKEGIALDSWLKAASAREKIKTYHNSNSKIGKIFLDSYFDSFNQNNIILKENGHFTLRW